MAGKINILPPDVANKIAAGEVIERPASVVKELVENAIDAGATNIEVHVEEGGRRRIEVRDNGCGMSAQDAVVAFQRHATSKIQALEDLFRIRTLGFRGEALPSIAAIAQVELTTRDAESEVGTHLLLEAGEVREMREVGCPRGTTFVVRNIFYNTPARLKFLRSPMTEMGHIADTVSRFILSHHSISFLLTHNDQEVTRSPGVPDLLSAVGYVYGKEVAREMVPVRYESPSLSLEGFVSKPTTTRASRNRQSFFVNGRFVRSRSLTHAVQQAYHGLLHGDRYPFVVLLLTIDPQLVDANVHPTKIEVRFSHEGEIYNTVHKAIRQALLATELDRPLAVEPLAPRVGSLPPQPSAPGRPLRLTLPSFTPASMPPTTPHSSNLLQAETSLPSPSPSSRPLAMGLRPLSQIRNTYILAESEEGLFIINQHRAHERILCEEALRKARNAPVEKQRLVIPLTVEVSHREAITLRQNLETVRSLGFEVEPFGGDTFVIRSVPALIVKQNYEQIFRDVVDELAHSPTLRGLENKREALLMMIACHCAIKAGDFLRQEEIDQLLRDLQRVENPYLCPHGQPIIISISHEDLDKKFERT